MCIHVDLAFGERQQLNFLEMLLDDLFRAGCALKLRKFGEMGFTEQRWHAVSPAVPRSDDGTTRFIMSPNKSNNHIPSDERLITTSGRLRRFGDSA